MAFDAPNTGAPTRVSLFRTNTPHIFGRPIAATRLGRQLRAAGLDPASVRAAIINGARRAVVALEPWYDWGEVHVERMDAVDLVDGELRSGGEGPVRFFDFQWFGVDVGIQLGRTPRRVVPSLSHKQGGAVA